jgi:hypothetical protein
MSPIVDYVRKCVRVIYGRGIMSEAAKIGLHLRQWRQRRRMSQLELANEAKISARHPSFLEPDAPLSAGRWCYTEDGLLSLFTTTMMFGTLVDTTLSELAIESFFPADAGTAALLKRS